MAEEAAAGWSRCAQVCAKQGARGSVNGATTRPKQHTHTSQMSNGLIVTRHGWFPQGMALVIMARDHGS
jgi:hypothetical protein